MSDIEKTRIDFNRKTNEVILSTLEKKVNMIQSIQAVLSDEFNKKVTTSIENQIETLKNESKNYSPEILSQKMTELMDEMNEGLKNFPDNMKVLQTEMVAVVEQTVKQIEEQSSLLELSDNNNEGFATDSEPDISTYNIFNDDIASKFSNNQQRLINSAYAEALEEKYVGSHNIFIVTSLIDYFEKYPQVLDRLTTTLSENELVDNSKNKELFSIDNLYLLTFSTVVKEYISIILKGKNEEMIVISINEKQKV